MVILSGLAIAGGGSASSVWAQQTPAPAESAPAEPSAEAEQAPAAVEEDSPVLLSEGTADVNLSPAELSAGAQTAVESVVGASERITRQTKEARKGGDVVKTLCLDDKRQQIETARGTISDRQTRLAEALAAGAIDSAKHHFTLVIVLGERVAVLVEEAAQCVGEETSLSQDNQNSQLSLVVDDSLPPVEPNTLNLTPIVSVTPSVNSAVD